MKKVSPREVENAVEQWGEKATETSETGEITVSWGEANPQDRPEGVAFNPDSGTLQYDLWNAQKDALEAVERDNTDICGFLAGYGSGKSVFGARWLLKQAIEHSDSRFLVMGKSFSEARSTTFRILFEQLPGERTGLVTKGYNGPEQSPVVRDYHKSQNKLTLTNDTVIKLGSADKWDRAAGDSYGGAWLDEPSHYSDLHNILEMIGSRFRGESGPKTQLWTLTGNGQNAAYDILERQVDENGDTLGLEIDVIKASTLDNPYLDKSDRERFKRQYAGTSREAQALHGGFAASAGNLLKRETLQFTPASETPETVRWYVGVDLGIVTSSSRAKQTDSDYTAVVIAAYHEQSDTAYLVDCERFRGKSLDGKIRTIQEKIAQLPNPTIVIEAVGGQKWLVDRAREVLSGRVIAENPTTGKEARFQDMSVLMDNEQVVLVNYEPDENLGYDPRWQDFVREWSQFGGNNDGHDDLLDAGFYSLTKIPFGQSSGVNLVTGDLYDRR